MKASRLSDRACMMKFPPDAPPPWIPSAGVLESRLRLVHFRSSGPQAQDTALGRSYDDLPSRGTREGARALWLDGDAGPNGSSSPVFPDRSLAGALVRPGPARARGSPPRTCWSGGRSAGSSATGEPIPRTCSRGGASRLTTCSSTPACPGDRRGSLPIGECTSDNGVHVHREANSMCAPAIPYMAVLQLHHGRKSGDADPELSAVAGSDPPFGDASIGIAEGWHVHAHASPARGRSRPSIPAGRPWIRRSVMRYRLATGWSGRLPSASRLLSTGATTGWGHSSTAAP